MNLLGVLLIVLYDLAFFLEETHNNGAPFVIYTDLQIIEFLKLSYYQISKLQQIITYYPT
jgi:hypothetical protein